MPIILTSGLPEAAARERLGRPDVTGFLPKPFRIEHLVKTLEGALDPLPAAADPPPPPLVAEDNSSPDASGLSGDAPPAAEPFDLWFLRRVAEAVGRGEVPEQLLSRLQADFDAAGDASADLPRLAAVWEIADLAGIPSELAAAVLGALERLPAVTQEPLIRRIAEAWLEMQHQRHLTSQRPEESE